MIPRVQSQVYLFFMARAALTSAMYSAFPEVSEEGITALQEIRCFSSKPSSENLGQIVGTRKSLNGRKNIWHEEK